MRFYVLGMTSVDWTASTAIWRENFELEEKQEEEEGIMPDGDLDVHKNQCKYE